MRHWLLLFSCSLLVLTCLLSAVRATSPGVLNRGDRIAILVADPSSRQDELAADDLVTYLQKSLQAVVRRCPLTTEQKDIDEDAYLVIGVPRTASAIRALAAGAGVSLPIDRLGPEGGLLKGGTTGGKTVLFLVGQTPVGASHAVYSFLERDLGVGFFIDSDQIPKREAVKIGGIDRSEIPVVPIRGLFFHHTWKHPYANNWRLWSFGGWQKVIDWMRRKRFNTLPLFCDEGGYLWGDIIFRTFPEIPRNDRTLAQFVVDPSWRTDLNHKIFRYARESGIRIAYNLFYSQVPEFFADFHPELKYHELNMRNVGVSAIQPQCRAIMKRYWKAILDTHGIDDSHLYLVCPYQHERSLPDYYENKIEPTLQAYNLLKELDPKARVYIESWCWKYSQEKTEERSIQLLTDNVAREWQAFDKGVPKEIGVIEWDLNRNHGAGLPQRFEGRNYIQLTHTNMEGWWPPSTTRNHPQWLIDYFGRANQAGAEGFIFFHIQAGHTELLADLASEICWSPKPDLSAFYLDYARRRFGAAAAPVLADSLRLFCDAADLGATSATAEYFTSLTFPGTDGSAEAQLLKLAKQGAERRQWLEQRLRLFEPKAVLAAKALMAARVVSPDLAGQPLYDRYLWELDYLAGRFEGILSLYRAHLLYDRDPTTAADLYRRAQTAFAEAKELFRNRKEYHMSALRELEPEVPYTSAFLKDWETRGFWEPRSWSFHVVWERLGHFEELMAQLNPDGSPNR